jgi:hypothetical protein
LPGYWSSITLHHRGPRRRRELYQGVAARGSRVHRTDGGMGGQGLLLAVAGAAGGGDRGSLSQRFVSVYQVFYNSAATQPSNSRIDKLSGLEDATGVELMPNASTTVSRDRCRRHRPPREPAAPRWLPGGLRQAPQWQLSRAALAFSGLYSRGLPQARSKTLSAAINATRSSSLSIRATIFRAAAGVASRQIRCASRY